MTSRSSVSIRSSSSSVRSNNASIRESHEGTSDGVRERRVSSSAWSVWGGRKDSISGQMKEGAIAEEPPTGNRFPDEGNQTWWRKTSHTSLRAVSAKGSSPEETPTSPTTEKTKEEPNEQFDATDKVGEPKRKGWFFWGKRPSVDDYKVDEVMESPVNTAVKPVINELISGPTEDAILYKTKSKNETANEQDLQNANESQGLKSNILTPSFEILPEYTTLASLYTNFGKYGHKWKLLGNDRMKQMSLYRRKPAVALNEMTGSSERSVKVLIVGVHGFFPTKMIRPIIGEPTGTSTKFITEAEKSVIRWFREQKTPVEISKIALEKEGEVFDRINFFFEVMKKWAAEIKKADFIYFVAHSQGCPVTIILLAKLIEAGIIDLDQMNFDTETPISEIKDKTRKIVGVLAMAGVNNGPFYGADQTLFVRAYSAIESDSLKELFQFQNFNSVQARKLVQSIRIIIASNVKICFVGSINDQLVPLYSSNGLFVDHPNIFRATFIDKDSRTPDFITRIVSIANHLNNLGYDDHNIIKEISGSLAGTLTGGGHSKIYNEGQVYDLGIKFALETTDVALETPVNFRPYQVDMLGSNPYHLPWCMRGLLFEARMHLGQDQIHQLFEEFEDWNPETKQLKDVKYRLNGLKSKL